MSNADTTIVTVTGRFLGGGLFHPREKEEGKVPDYNAAIALDPGQEEKIAAIRKAALAAEFGNKIPPGLTDWTLREGDDPEYASFGLKYINPKKPAKSKKTGALIKRPPTYVRRDGALVMVEADDEVFYPGCYVAASVAAFAYPGDKAKSIKPGVTLQLRQVLFLRDGEPLGEQLDGEADFAGLESEEKGAGNDDFI